MTFDLLVRRMLTPAFRFVVAIDGVPLGAFTECTLPTMELDVESLKEGGLDTYVHQLPGYRKAATITLKNGVGVARVLLALYRRALSGKPLRVHVTVTLLSALLIPIMVLDIKDACPVKWTGPQLKTDDNTVAIQTLELACGEVTVA